MKKVFEKVMGAMGMLEYEDDYITEDYEGEQAATFGFATEEMVKPMASNSQPKILSMNNSAQIKMVVVNPQTYDEAKDISDYIKSKKPVVVNLETMNSQVAQRVMDFLSGSCYSMNGNIQRVTKNIFVLAPDNVDIAADMSGQFKAKSDATLPWMKVTK